MIDVGVSDDDLLEREAEFGEPAMNSANLVAGIDDDRLAGIWIPQQRAVAGERSDGKGLQNHDLILYLLSLVKRLH